MGDIYRSEPISKKSIRQRFNFLQHFIPNFRNLANSPSIYTNNSHAGAVHIGAISNSPKKYEFYGLY